ncbi:tripartite tricarboxylate transporter substrate binding protein [Variovorax sp. J22P168]|uniref:Bug family tripartite tricarboxylate transporter substrate binding protein n=1 Tax=Variovorax jilinensis TaxID=3053513 RepID=UPI002578D464|nr:tripartite tricarboxylate transporter substrate binding protein [Variovorax sp. J22P168]MDM0015796.1 tripartite tricarboxylate transporter substrate binding protein [Variovorax sp. J22P168]
MHRPLSRPRRQLLLAALAALAPLSSRLAQAEEPYPSRPIMLVLGNAPGSGGDLLCRTIAAGLGASLKQPVVVENRVGANSTIAALAVVRAKPDGYTLLFGNASSTVINQAVQKAPAFDALNDLAPIAQVGAGGVALVATPDFPASDMQQFTHAAKAHPGAYDYASWGTGSQGHLVMEWLERQSGIRMNHVPYKSITAITQDMQGGVIRLGFLDVASAMPLVKQGRLKVLGLTGSLRSPGLPSAPLMAEQGIGPTADGWYGVFAPRGTPTAVVALLNQEVARILASPAMREKLLQLNIADAPLKSPEQFAKTVRDDLAFWQRIAQAASIKVGD